MKKYQYKAGEIIEVKEVINQDSKGNSEYTINCPRCEGHGKLKQYNHVLNGQCFKCNGYGTLEKQGKLYTLEEAEKLQKRYIEKKRKEQEQKMQEQKETQEKYETELKRRKEEAKKEAEAYQETLKKQKKTSKEEFINTMLESQDLNDLRCYIGDMKEYQVIEYIKLSIKLNGKIKGKKSIMAHFENNKEILDMLK